MSAGALPISAARFAEALRDLSIDSLHRKVLELRNEIIHLNDSNDQLLPYARGTAAVLGADTVAPDPDCIDAIQENLEVIQRKIEQLRLVRIEVEEHRGIVWTEFQSKEVEWLAAEHAGTVLAADAPPINGANGGCETTTNGTAAHGLTGNPWTDGTFQTGTVRNGVLQMGTTSGTTSGNFLNDDALRQALETRLHNGDARQRDDTEEEGNDGGLHL